MNDLAAILGFDPPPFERRLVRLRLSRPAAFPCEHGGVLRGLLSRALGRHELPAGLLPFAPEAGRVRFAAGDGYFFGVTFVGEARRLAEPLRRGLERLGVAAGPEPRPVLGGNFVVEGFEPCPAPDPAADADAVVAGEALDVTLIAPLRVERPPALRRPGAGYLNGECFPARWFLDLLWRRLAFLAAGRYPTAEEIRAHRPPWPREARARARELLWVDLPVRGTEAKGRPYTLGGVRGRVSFAGLSEAWRAVLLLGAHLHAGQKTLYGFGRYQVAGTAEAARPAFPPARPLLEGAPGLGDSADRRLAWKRVADALAPALDARVEETATFFRRGLSRRGGARARARAEGDGFHHAVAADLRSFYDLIDPRVALDRLQALYPAETGIERIESEMLRGEGSPGLPVRHPLSAPLARLCLDHLADALEARGLRLLRDDQGFVVLIRDLGRSAGSAA